MCTIVDLFYPIGVVFTWSNIGFPTHSLKSPEVLNTFNRVFHQNMPIVRASVKRKGNLSTLSTDFSTIHRVLHSVILQLYHAR